MDEKRLRNLALKSLSTMFGIILLSAGISRYNDIELYASSENYSQSLTTVSENNFPTSHQEVKEQIEDVGTEQYVDVLTGVTVNQISDKYIKIKKEKDGQADILVQDLYMQRMVRITFENLEEKIYTKQSVSFSNLIVEPENIVLNYIYDPQTFLYSAVFDINLDGLYTYKTYESDQSVYIELLNPKEVYEKIIVVDAGHGGNDIGTYAKDMEYYEKDINLSVVLYLKKLLDTQENYKVYYTRLTDEKVYLNPRLNLANDLDADLFLSVHCNGSEYQSASGIEVLYGSVDVESGKFSSKRFAEIALENLSNTIGSKNRGLLKDDGIYIIGNSHTPIALVELGFMSNTQDMKFLAVKKNRKLIAKSLYQTILDACEEMKEVGL